MGGSRPATLVQPPLGLLLACVVLGVLDATAGLTAAACYLVVALLAGHLVTADSWRLALGVVSLWVLIPLIAAAARPIHQIRRTRWRGLRPGGRLRDRGEHLGLAGGDDRAVVARPFRGRHPGGRRLVGMVALTAFGAVVLRLVVESLVKVGYPQTS